MNKFVVALVFALVGAAAPSLLLAQGDAAAGQAKSALCASCHGNDGNSALAINPKLAGQNAAYIVKQLMDFKSGVRADPIMAAMVLSGLVFLPDRQPAGRESGFFGTGRNAVPCRQSGNSSGCL